MGPVRRRDPACAAGPCSRAPDRPNSLSLQAGCLGGHGASGGREAQPGKAWAGITRLPHPSSRGARTPTCALSPAGAAKPGILKRGMSACPPVSWGNATTGSLHPLFSSSSSSDARTVPQWALMLEV